MRRAVFLDRDGVLNEVQVRDGKPHPPSSLAETIIVDDARESLRRLKAAGFSLFVVTNQPDVARGTTPRETVDSINAYLAANLAIDEFWTCFHDDKDQCECRKPRPGLLFQAAAKYELQLERSFLIGDRWRDIQAARAAGCRSILIDRAYRERRSEPEFSVFTLTEAVDWILKQS